MNTISAIAIFFVIWWTTLFAVLPFGVRNSHEAGVDVQQGNEAGAPVAHGLKWKLLVTTLIAAVVFSGVHYVLVHHLLETMTIPFMEQLPKI